MMAALEPFPSQSFNVLFTGIVSGCLAAWLEEMLLCYDLMSVGAELCSNDPCWEVLPEQIRRCYPVNKEPAETGCEQQPTEVCDFKEDLLMTDSWSVYHFFFFIECDTEGRLDCSNYIQEKLRFIFLGFLLSGLISQINVTFFYICYSLKIKVDVPQQHSTSFTTSRKKLYIDRFFILNAIFSQSQLRC